MAHDVLLKVAGGRCITNDGSTTIGPVGTPPFSPETFFQLRYKLVDGLEVAAVFCENATDLYIPNTRWRSTPVVAVSGVTVSGDAAGSMARIFHSRPGPTTVKNLLLILVPSDQL